MQRVLVVDDDPAMTSVLKPGAGLHGCAVDAAGSGAEGLELARDRPPDVAQLDIMRPGIDGLEVLRRLRAADSQLPIRFLTGRDAPSDQVQGLEQGADDYVTKPFTFEVLAARVRALLRRREADQPAVLRFADLFLDTGTRRPQRAGRQFSAPRQVLPKEFLMERVWGYEFGGNTNVLEVYVKQLRQKLEANAEPRFIHTLRGTGYVLREE